MNKKSKISLKNTLNSLISQFIFKRNMKLKSMLLSNKLNNNKKMMTSKSNKRMKKIKKKARK